MFSKSSHTGIKSLLCNCTVPFKFDDVKDDRKLYMNNEARGIEISKKILPLWIEFN